MASLLVLEGPHAGSQLELGAETTLGRSPTCDLVIDDANVSRRHAQILIEGAAATLVDLGSRNGSFLNGVRVSGRAELKPGDRVQVGPLALVFDPDPLRVFVAPAPTAPPLAVFEAPQISEAPVPPVLRQVFENVTRAPTPAAALRVTLESAITTLGASRGLLVSLPPEGERPEVLLLGGGEIFSVPATFEAPLRQGQAAQSGTLVAVPMGLPSHRHGALVLERGAGPLASAQLGLLFDISRLGSRVADGAQARQTLQPTAFPLALLRERPALLSPAFRRCLERITHAARHHGPLLLVGEAATGRDELALTVHQMSQRADGPFVSWRQPPADPLDPAKLPPIEALVNALQRAEGGSLYLGAISSWSVPLAELWARELDRFSPSLISRDARLPSPVRLIAASSDPLGQLALSARLPAALVARFDGERVEVPPLRKRKADLPMLVERLSAAAGQRLGRAVPTFSSAALKALAEYSWPGNLAELQVCLEWALFACGPETEVQLWDLPPLVRSGQASDREHRQPLAEMIAALERTAIVEALRESGFKKIHAAAALGISRPTLDKKIADYQIRLKP